jgi:hypothetical protein
MISEIDVGETCSMVDDTKILKVILKENMIRYIMDRSCSGKRPPAESCEYGKECSINCRKSLHKLLF